MSAAAGRGLAALRGRPSAMTLLRAITDAFTDLVDLRWPPPARLNVADDPCTECGVVGICHSPDCAEAFRA